MTKKPAFQETRLTKAMVFLPHMNHVTGIQCGHACDTYDVNLQQTGGGGGSMNEAWNYVTRDCSPNFSTMVYPFPDYSPDIVLRAGYRCSLLDTHVLVDINAERSRYWNDSLHIHNPTHDISMALRPNHYDIECAGYIRQMSSENYYAEINSTKKKISLFSKLWRRFTAFLKLRGVKD